MGGTDFEELFKSPLDPPRADRPDWRPLLFGVATGLLAAAVALFWFGSGGREAAGAPTTVTTTSSPTAQSLVYPPGYVEIASDLAAKPVAIVVGDETIEVCFVAVVARGSDPNASNWPLGGTWFLEAADGGVAASDRVVLFRSSPGIFAVEFPRSETLGPATALRRVTMTSRWDHTDVSGTIMLPYAGAPFTAAEPVSADVGGGVSLTLPLVELGRYQGSIEWNVTGPAPQGARVIIGATLLDDAGEAIGSYGDFPSLLEPGHDGIIDLTWQQPFRISQEGTAAVRLDYTVGIVEVADTEIGLDLGDVPTGR